jgi:hypothetical protein
MRNIFAIVIVALALLSCSPDIKKDFETTFEKYNDALVSSDIRSTVIFVAEKAKDPYVKSYEAAKNSRIFESRIIRKTVDTKTREASIEVELDYYLLNSNKVKSLKYVQQWALIEENKEKEWRLLTPLPEFK